MNGNPINSLLMGSCLMNSFQLPRRREMQQKMKLQETRGACLPQQSLEQSLCMGRRLLQFMADCIPTWSLRIRDSGTKSSFCSQFQICFKKYYFQKSCYFILIQKRFLQHQSADILDVRLTTRVSQVLYRLERLEVS